MRTRGMFGGIGATIGLIFGGLGLTAVASVVNAVPAAAATLSGITCPAPYPGTIPGGTYSSLTMPPGSQCLIEGTVVVNRGITLGTGSGLGVDTGSLTVNGPVTVGPDAVLAPVYALLVSPEATPAPITVNGPVTVQTNGWFSTFGPTIAGPVRATDPSGVQIFDTDISGPVVINGGGGENLVMDALGLCYGKSAAPSDCPAPNYAYNQNFLAGNEIDGPVSVTNYDGKWQGIIYNVMGPMTFSDNNQFVGSAIGFNVINGPATCSENFAGSGLEAPNTGPDVSGPSVVNGPTRGDQASTCTGVLGGTWGE